MIVTADRQADAHAGLLGREERLKQVHMGIVAKSMSGIRNGNFNHIIGCLGVGDDQLAMGRTGHRFQRIAEEIDQHLLDLDPIGNHLVVGRIELEAQHKPLFASPGEPERAGFLDQLRKTFDVLLRCFACDEIAQSPDDVTGADGLFRGAVERGLDLRRVDVGAISEQAA